jgi:hypothetical protein
LIVDRQLKVGWAAACAMEVSSRLSKTRQCPPTMIYADMIYASKPINCKFIFVILSTQILTYLLNLAE